jgi:hypothetical protein
VPQFFIAHLLQDSVPGMTLARRSRNQISEYLPQMRKGREVGKLRVQMICKRLSLFSITLASLRLGEKYPIPIVF